MSNLDLAKLNRGALTPEHAPFVVEEHLGHLGGLLRVAVPGPEEQQHLPVVVGRHAQVPLLQQRAELGDPLLSLGGQVADVLGRDGMDGSSRVMEFILAKTKSSSVVFGFRGQNNLC